MSSPKERAIEFGCNASFHRSLTLPKTSKYGPLRVTYATTTNFFAEDVDTVPVLWVGAMIASRYMVYDLNHIAEKSGVRFIFIDRPGFGGTTSVPINQRIDVWLEIVPAILAKLGVQHVSLVSHSAGTLPLLNTLLRLRDILHPTRPYIALMGPSSIHNPASS